MGYGMVTVILAEMSIPVRLDRQDAFQSFRCGGGVVE
jgi:hypothetical protein